MQVLQIDIITPPAAPVVTAEEFIDHARLNALTVDRQPDLIQRELDAATERAQSYTRRSFITQGVRALFIGGYYGCAGLVLPRPPVQSVERITTPAGDIDPSGYVVNGALIWLRSPISSQVVVEYTAGYGDAADAVPQMIREGILEYVTRLYETRSGEGEQKFVATAGRTLPAGVIDLWRPFQVELSG